MKSFIRDQEEGLTGEQAGTQQTLDMLQAKTSISLHLHAV